MAATPASHHLPSLNPVRAVLLAGALPLFLGAFLADWAYSSTYEVQWTNFASWLIAGGLVFVGSALVWTIVEALRGAGWIAPGLLAATFAAGFVNALVHAKDAWAAMPAGLILSLIVLALALAAIWAGFAGFRGRRSA
jgi:uncharacterized membrane protein